MIVSSVGAGAIMRVINAEDSANRVRAFNVERFLLPAVESVVEEAEGKGTEELVQLFGDSWLGKSRSVFSLTDSHGTVLMRRGPPDLVRIMHSPDRSGRTWRHNFTHNGESFSLLVLPRDRDHRKPPMPFPRGGFGLLLILGIAFPISVILSILIARYLIRPLASFERAGMRLADGDLSARINPSVSARGDELADFANTFDYMAERLERLVHSHKELLRDVSHELRSPLARVHATLSLARQRTGGAVDDEMDRIELEVDRLDSLIGKLLTFSRLDSRKLLVEQQLVNVEWVLADVIGDALIEAAADDKHVELSESGDLRVTGDSELLASCFENIIRNAVRHTPPESTVDVSLSTKDEDPSRCFITVRDRGAGLAEKDLSTVFELFRKFDDQGGENTGSSGIGLAIADKVVKLHNGGISAANAPDGGLIIAVWLPLAN